MESRLGFALTRRVPDFGRLARFKNAAVVLLAALLVLPLTLWLLKPMAVPDLAHGDGAGLKALNAGWASGQMIVLVRHVERCDHSRAACLGAADGITDRSRDVAVGVGAQFEHLGLDRADIYHSPLTRAVQTADYMFSDAGSGEDWLFNCKNTMLHDALAHKVPGRNLILVTHSECMAQLEKDLKLPVSSFGYGASLFVSSASLEAAPKMLGFIEASDWRSLGLDRR